jgi:hypothetical protein
MTLTTGTIFSTTTPWGFFKRRWIAVKYIINIVPIILGAAVLAPSVLNMLFVAEIMGENAIFSSEFQTSKSIFLTALIIVIALLLTALYLSVFKPSLKR